MARKDKTKELKQKSRFAAMEGLRPKSSFPIPPRKAVSQAKKASKNLAYPVSPYPDAGPTQVYRWAQNEWWKLGRWQSLALPFIIISALLTWEREKSLQDARWEEVDRIEAKQLAEEMYLAPHKPPRKRKLLGIIPLPGRN